VSDFQVLEPAVDPGNRISFLLDWELTMKCNLDCSYCGQGLYGGHDNTTKHPPLQQCLETIDFMFQYVDIYMQTKPRGIKYVILNVYGGESLHHPDIVVILQKIQRVYEQQYRDRWHLTITTTTNAIITKLKLCKIMPFIDEFTVSYHAENIGKQKAMFKSNILDLVAAGKRLKCVILMHAQPDLFEDAKQMIAWCEQNGIKYLPRQLDREPEATHFDYTIQAVKWFDNMYAKKTYEIKDSMVLPIKDVSDKINLSSVGRACCGGRNLCKDKIYNQRDFYVDNKFPDWFCSVNEFFLYIKQVNGEIYTNKDCKMNFDGTVGPIGNLADTQSLLTWLKTHLNNKSLPTIQCKKTSCLCGLCAPKAKTKTDFDTVMEKYRI
jgi:hypothetical protein